MTNRFHRNVCIAVLGVQVGLVGSYLYQVLSGHSTNDNWFALIINVAFSALSVRNVANFSS